MGVRKPVHRGGEGEYIVLPDVANRSTGRHIGRRGVVHYLGGGVPANDWIMRHPLARRLQAAHTWSPFNASRRELALHRHQMREVRHDACNVTNFVGWMGKRRKSQAASAREPKDDC